MTVKTQYLDKAVYAGLLLFAFSLPISTALTNIAWIWLLLSTGIKIVIDRNMLVRTILDRPFFWLLAITAMSTITAIDPWHSFQEWRQISLITIYWLMVNMIKDEEQLKKMVYYFVVGSVLVSLYGIMEYVLGINMIDQVIVSNPYSFMQAWPATILRHLSLDHGRVIATRSHPLTFAEGIMMALCFVFCLGVFSESKSRRNRSWLVIIVIGLCLLFTNSRGPWLGAVIGLVSLLFFKPSKKVLIAVVAALIAIPIMIYGVNTFTHDNRNSIVDRLEKAKNWRSDGDSRERVLMWQSGREMIKDRPLLGLGLGNIHEVYLQYKSAKAWHTGVENELHSNIVQIAVERGLLGLAMFIWVLVAFFREGYRTLKILPDNKPFLKAVTAGGLLSVVSCLGAGFTETTYNDSEVIMIFYFMMGMVMWIRQRTKIKDEIGYSDIAVFMDRDGTISEEVGYINHPDRLKLLKRSSKAIRLLNKNKIRAVVVTNQAGVGRGYFKEKMISVVHKKMEAMLAKDGVFLDAIYYCPHHPKDNCNCRKPKPGMMLQAKEKFGLDLTKCYVIGDKYSDVEYAHQVGAKGILVLTGYGKGAYEFEKEQWSKGPDFVASDLYDAVEWIARQEKK